MAPTKAEAAKNAALGKGARKSAGDEKSLRLRALAAEFGKERLGRVLRPKSDGREATFYSLVTRDSRDQDFAHKRQRFLMEQGYQYEIEEQEEVLN